MTVQAEVQRLCRAGRVAQAEALCRQRLQADARDGAAWHALGCIDRDAGRHALAARRFAQAARHAPRSLQVQADLGTALLAVQDHAGAEAVWRELAERAPDDAAHPANLGVALHRLGRPAEASVQYRRALALSPTLTGVRANLASALRDLGDAAGAAEAYGAARATAPGDPALYSNWLFASSHQTDLSPQELVARHRAYAALLSGVVPLAPPPRTAVRPAGRRLRIGFVSADLRDHAVAFFVLPVWRAIDRSRFEIVAYDNATAHDATTQALRALADAWREVRTLDDAQLAALIRADGIDVLVDLSGHTAGNRLPAFALRPAPVQASWIGYPGSTGLPAVDYLLTDRYMAPPGAGDDADFVEKLIRLPAAVGFEPPPGAPEPGPLPALSSGTLTLGSFHRPSKLSERTLARWSSVLRALPGSRLLLGHCDDAQLAAHLLGRFAAHGVDATRLLLRPRLPLADYLALHHEVDLVLDACEFSGGTTTALALWMGVPVLSVAGPSMPSRQSAAILQHVGLGAFVAADEDDLVAHAAAWAGALPELAALRAGLRERLQVLRRDGAQQVTRGLEQAMVWAWQQWREGRPAAELTLDASGAGEGPSPPRGPVSPPSGTAGGQPAPRSAMVKA